MFSVQLSKKKKKYKRHVIFRMCKVGFPSEIRLIQIFILLKSYFNGNFNHKGYSFYNNHTFTFCLI